MSAGNLSRFERWVGTQAIKMLRWTGDRAMARGDAHEMAHCYLGVLASESTHDQYWPCVNVEVRDLLTGNHMEHGPKTSRRRG